MKRLILMLIWQTLIILSLSNITLTRLGNAAAQDDNDANGILKNATIAVPLKYLSNFWRSLEMPLINCKVELKLRWSKHCVLSVSGIDNANCNTDNNNIIFTIKDTKLYVRGVTLSARDNQNYQSF